YGSGIKREKRYVLEKLGQTVKAAGGALDYVGKGQGFHNELRDFKALDEGGEKFFPTPPPPPTNGTTAFAGARPPVEIDLIATMPQAPGRVVKSDGPRPLAAYSEAVVVGDLVFAAGQLASDFKTGVPREARVDPAFPFYGSDIKRQTRFILENLVKTLKAAGTSPH